MRTRRCALRDIVTTEQYRRPLRHATKIEDRTGAIHTVIVLDEIEFLLENNGDSLLYFLSRMKKPV